MKQPRRVTELDGLRGAAAFIVLVHHGLLATWLGLANTYRGEPTSPETWLLAETPLRVIWAGHEAVIVFFVLSGYVLVLPFVAGRPFNAGSYYPARLIRLYLPVWGALLFAATLHAISGWETATGTWWLEKHRDPMDTTSAILVGSLVRASADFSYFSAIWSLKWELLFSLLMPAALFAVALGRKQRIFIIFACCLLIGSDISRMTTYLPMFVIGSALACEREACARLASSLSRTGRASAACILILGFTIGFWWPAFPDGLITLAGVLAAAGAVALIACGTWGVLFGSPPLRWLGSRSFSLYLIHEPVIVTVILAGGTDIPGPLSFAAAVAAALVVSEIFFRVCERPSHRLARRAAKFRGSQTTTA